MGLVYTDITLKNPRMPELTPMRVRALADTGAVHMCIPPQIALQLGLETLDTRGVILADGTSKKLPYVGPLQVCFGDRFSFTGALVAGDEVLLGAIAMEDMDLVVQPMMQSITVNPAHPNFPVVSMKGSIRSAREKLVITAEEKREFCETKQTPAH